MCSQLQHQAPGISGAVEVNECIASVHKIVLLGHVVHRCSLKASGTKIC